MDISNTYKPATYMPPSENMSGGALGYDMEEEKKRIAMGILELKKEIKKGWNRKYANAQIFPQQIALMHPEVVDFLLSFTLVSVYDSIAKQAGLDAKGRNILPRIVWEIAQTKNWNGLDQILEAKLPLVHSAHVSVVNLLKQNILDKIKVISEKPAVKKVIESEEKPAGKAVQLILVKALSQYPRIGEQNITSEQIKLRMMPELVRPSIKNWMREYSDVMGAKKHSPIDRGNFLFHSENGKKLSATDRQKLAVVLKSLDEEAPLAIDIESQKVIFDKAEVEMQINKQPVSPAIGAPVRQSVPVEPRFAQPARDNEKMVPHREEKVENLFQIPESKPPIGSDDFNVQKSTDPQEISDDELFEMIKNKKEVQGAQKNIAPNFAGGNDRISFSSPQKLPAEQIAKPAQVQMSKSQSISQAPTATPFRILPSDYSKREMKEIPNVQKNIVDLKN